jgi:hypothetical protein
MIPTGEYMIRRKERGNLPAKSQRLETTENASIVGAAMTASSVFLSSPSESAMSARWYVRRTGSGSVKSALAR